MLSTKLDPLKFLGLTLKSAGFLLEVGTFCILFLLFSAVSRNAYAINAEVRRQFKEIPGLNEGKEDVCRLVTKCVDMQHRPLFKG
jgi:Na+/H+-translocating membrane pyrophosphatase